MINSRPNPDLLLKQINAEEKKNGRGHFRLFFGMAAGVGKTYAMLRTAQMQLKEGINVQVGIVETHERAGTKSLLDGLTVIPRKKIEYRGTILEEMDLDEILRRKPQLVLIDELAHTNIPGSRHEKRYQDVQEILEAGIDVYSTMNVQHLESRSDVIGLITATQIRETVPDSIMDWVDQIELIDLTPKELLERLKEGKVYPGRKIDQALQYFFQEKHLSTLREIVLRVTADKVDRDTRGMLIKEQISKPSMKTEKLLIAVSPSPHSDRLIRTARRLVEDLEISWIAAHVDTGEILDTESNNQLIKNLELAHELGAETITLHGINIVSTISEYAKENGIIQIVIGRPEKSNFWKLKSRDLVQKLIENNPQADIIVLKKENNEIKKRSRTTTQNFLPLQWKHLIKITTSLVITTLISFIISPMIGYRTVGFLYLLNVVILSILTPFKFVFTAAALSVLAWNYFFIPPSGTFTISEPEDIMMCVAYFIISSVTGYLTAQIRKNQNILKIREETTRALYELLKSMTFVKGQKSIISLAISKIENLFSAKCCVLISKNTKELCNDSEFGSLTLSENELAVAFWAFEHGKMAGWSTDTLPASGVLCITLKSGDQKFGILAFKPKEDRKLNPEQHNLLISITNQISVALIKERYEEETKNALLLKESEKLHQTLLNCISHELRTPLTAIMGAATTLQASLNNSTKSIPVLTEEIVDSSERLNRVFENLLDMTRLESGMIKLYEEWLEISELLNFTVERQKRFLAQHSICIFGTAKPLYIYGDYNLLEHAFSNLLLNAGKYSPRGTDIIIKIEKIESEIIISIKDHGPGIPKDLIPHIFEKFYRIPGTPSGGLGLGLSITKNLIELHRGKIKVANCPEGGTIFSIILPYQEPPALIQEEAS